MQKTVLQSVKNLHSILNGIETAMQQARGGRYTAPLYNIMEKIKVYTEKNGLEFDMFDVPASFDEMIIQKFYRRIMLRFANYSRIAQTELEATLSAIGGRSTMEAISSYVGLEDAREYARIAIQANEMTKRRNILIAWSKAGGFTLAYKLVSYKDYRTLQALYSDVLTATKELLGTKMSNKQKLLDLMTIVEFAYDDFSTTWTELLKVNSVLTKFEKQYLADISKCRVKLPDNKTVKRIIQKRKNSHPEYARLAELHLEERAVKPARIYNVAPVRHIKPNRNAMLKVIKTMEEISRDAMLKRDIITSRKIEATQPAIIKPIERVGRERHYKLSKEWILELEPKKLLFANFGYKYEKDGKTRYSIHEDMFNKFQVEDYKWYNEYEFRTMHRWITNSSIRSIVPKNNIQYVDDVKFDISKSWGRADSYKAKGELDVNGNEYPFHMQCPYCKQWDEDAKCPTHS